MVSDPPSITVGEREEGGGGGLNMTISQNFVVKNFFLHLCQDKPLWVELNNKWGSNIYCYMATLLLFYFFRNSQHPERGSNSFKNFFRNSQCISCYFPMPSNLQL